jgi:hypothetical protein
VTSELWVGAITGLGGAVIGGGISLAVSRQQIRDARDQRTERAAAEAHRRSLERRFTAYADFYSRARAFRNSIRSFSPDTANPEAASRIDELARRAHDASALVFLVVESEATADACRYVVVMMSRIQGALRESDPATTDWPALNEEMRTATREFLAASRQELEVGNERTA